ncbi:hypothetical protein GCM10010840_29410 [Deinococcus aerolatus]|uniref:Uncharacterized protein n=1 Tax=Deinococcus aerolatus TaxID=522487 RepID=A0ABQ2GDK1_9DEIO|nr:hypothetical protein [Deinococcus aerolatus]GGL89419.1 hypothetical protein GCM10010840_29410 [Deinococcus aerolatus]
MSRAFVKEEAGAPWTPPSTPRAYRIVWTGDAVPGGPQQPEVMRETDDLLDALRWLSDRPRPGFELRDADGELLATNAA